MVAKTASPFIVPTLVGSLILAGSVLAFFQITEYREDLRQSSKDEYAKIIENMVDRREGRIDTVGSAILAFYSNSGHVTQHEFDSFADMILGSNSEILNIFVLENGTISRSYPLDKYVGNDFDIAFPEYPTQIDGISAMTGRYALDADTLVVVAVPFGFFVPEGAIPGNSYKITLLSPVDDHASLYQMEKDGDEMRTTVQFSDAELSDSVIIERQTNLFGHKLGKEYDLRYILWVDSFSETAYEHFVMLSVGAAMSFVIPVLLVRTNLLRQQLQAKSAMLEMANEDLKDTEKSKDEFVTMIVHDLKNPLVPIRAYSEILLSGKLGQLNGEQVKRLQSIKTGAETLQKMFRDLLDANKLELGKLALDIGDHSLSDIAKSTISELEPEFRKKGVRIEANLADMRCMCDAMRIGQVLNNLLLNSLDFVKEGTGVVEVRLASNGQSAVMSVRDNGAGIPQDKIGNLFAKFYQVHKDKNRKYGGSGLGLSVCKGIVEEHGGRIWAESGGEGTGTTVFVELPLKRPE